eukprot:7031722-Pyramimonas_sp.AAC.1
MHVSRPQAGPGPRPRVRMTGPDGPGAPPWLPECPHGIAVKVYQTVPTQPETVNDGFWTASEGSQAAPGRPRATLVAARSP